MINSIQAYAKVFDKIVKNAARWWCMAIDEPYDEDDQDTKRKAIICLRSEILNEKKLSALELAAESGATYLVEKMLNVKDVFVKDGTEEEGQDQDQEDPNHEDQDKKDQDVKQQKRYDVTDLVPQTVVKRPFVSDSESITNDQHKRFVKGLNTNKSRMSLLETIVQLNSVTAANEMLNIAPLQQMVANYYRVYQVIYGILMIVHIIHMSLFTYYGLSATRDAVAAEDTTDPVIDEGPSYVYSLFLPYPLLVLVFKTVYTVRRLRRNRQQFNFKVLHLYSLYRL